MTIPDELVQAAAEALLREASLTPSLTFEDHARIALQAAFATLKPIAWLHESTKTLYDRQDCPLCKPLYLIPTTESEEPL